MNIEESYSSSEIFQAHTDPVGLLCFNNESILHRLPHFTWWLWFHSQVVLGLNDGIDVMIS